ncbi:MAG: hypothetical protein NTW42_02900 [Deltaproteobacteria bacterium]|nr:hypothetical protein [Deltaproteobacteria bacterium]
MDIRTIRNNIFIKSLILILVFIISSVSTYSFINRDRLFPLKNKVIIYGREKCGITLEVRGELEKRNIEYIFANVDIPLIDSEMWYKLGPRFEKKTVIFPVVHIAEKMLLTPTADQIEKEKIQYEEVTDKINLDRDYTTFLNGANPPPHY